jgi:hypothetical protein
MTKTELKERRYAKGDCYLLRSSSLPWLASFMNVGGIWLGTDPVGRKMNKKGKEKKKSRKIVRRKDEDRARSYISQHVCSSLHAL